MSSNEDDYGDGEQASKKRRVQRACDICRRKKIRCDGGQMPGNRCSNCIAYSFDCTYIEAAKKRGPPKGYVERLEIRVEKLEKVLNRLYPDCDIVKELDATSDTDAFLDQLPMPRPASSDLPIQSQMPDLNNPSISLQPRHPCEIATSVIRKVGTTPVSLDEQQDYDDFPHLLLADDIRKLSLGDVEKNRFFGKSSGAMLVHTAIELKNEYTGGNEDILRPILGLKREEFWTIRPWERLHDPGPKVTFSFPEPDLMHTLIDLYFDQVNIFLPLLHRPSFKRAVASGLHLTDDGFGANLLLVCAVASRFSEDDRTKLDGVETFLSGGWKWFHQVQQMRKSLLAPPSLYDLQYYCLVVMFLQGSSAPQSCWTMVGIGIRLAQDVGAHRRKYDRNNLTVEDELWKRGFWVLVAMDRMVSSALGRPCAIQDEDFDVDFPLECDDEYWENSDPAKRFKQPPNKPSYITGFVLLLKLNQVLTIILRTIYSINRSKVMLGFVGEQWEQHIVAELDSALNKWVDSIPDHLRWDPNRENLRFFHQSASLYCTYYYIQILIHRSFIPSPRKPSPLSFPSLAICTNAARSCSHIIDIHRRRGLVAPPQIQISTFTSGIVLLLNIWGGKRSGMTIDSSKEMIDVHKCMQSLRSCESRWNSAGRLWDILYELATVGDLPLPNPSPPANNKRDRDSDSVASSTPTLVLDNSPTIPTASDAPRSIAGTRRITGKQSFSGQILPQQQQARLPRQTQSPIELQQSYPLPLYSNDLGKLPINPQPPFSASFMVQETAREPMPDLSLPFWGTNPVAGGMLNGTDGVSPSATYNHSPQGSTSSSAQYPGAGVYNPLSFGLSDMPYMQQQQASSASGKTTIGDMNYDSGVGTLAGVTSGQGVTMSANSMHALIDSDAIAMWSNPPCGFELDDWGTYLTSVSELTHGMPYQFPGSSGGG